MATITPNYSWPVPTSTDLVKDGASAIEALGDAIDATVFGLPASGLTLIKTQTIGTTVASVTVTGAFSATYNNYKILVSGGSSSATDFVQLTLGSTATGYSAGYLGLTFAGLAGNANDNNISRWNYAIYSNATKGMNGIVELVSPFPAVRTFMYTTVTANAQSLMGQGVQDSDTSFTAFTLTPNSGTLTGGKIYVYGYKI